MKFNKFLLLLLFVNCCFSQQITTAKIKTVAKNGLYKVFIPGEIQSASKPELGNFRIFDSTGKEVPYAMINPNYDGVHYKLSEFKIVSKQQLANKTTTIIVENPKSRLDEITLKISNAEVTKKFSISGSDNRDTWFGLVNSRELQEIKNERTTSDLKTIPLPITSYKYLKLILNDSLSLPLKIDAIGYFDLQKKAQKSELVTPQKFEIKNPANQKKTLITVGFNNPRLIQYITFDVKSPALYKRQVRIYKLVTQQNRRKKQIVQETIDEFELNTSTTEYQLYNPVLEKDFFIEIDNRDNPPLEFNSIKFSQQLIAIVADLKAGEIYSIKTGQDLAAPDYDLSYFTSDIHSDLPQTEITNVQQSNTPKAISSQKSVWQKPWFMWVCILLGGLAILFFSISLAKDVQKK